MDPDELDAVQRLAEFIVCIYVCNWFECTKAADAAANQLKLIKDLMRWRKIDSEVTVTQNVSEMRLVLNSAT
jgi:hypothetical protein